DEQGADAGGEPDPPGGGGGELLAFDEPVAQPAVQGGGGEAEFGGGGGHGEQLSFLRVIAGLVAGDAPVVAQALDPTGGVWEDAGGGGGRPVEDPRDLGVVVVDGEPADQADSVLIGAQPAGRGAFDRDRQFGDRPAFPPQDQVSAAAVVIAVDGDVDLVQQGAQQLFAVLVGGGGRVPDGLQIIAEGEDRGALGGGEGCRAGGLAAGELGFGGGQVGERFLPGGFQAAGDQPVAGVDGLVAALGLGGLVAGLLDLAAPLLQGSVVPLLELPGGLQA